MIRVLFTTLALTASITTASAQEAAPLGESLAKLTETYGKSIVTVVKETEIKMGGMAAMMGGMGGGDTTKSEAVGVVVGDNLIMGPRLAAEGPGGMLGGMLEAFGGQLQMEMEDLGTKVIGPDGEEYEAELLGDDEISGVAFWRIVGDDKPEMTQVSFPKAPRLSLGEQIVGLSPLPRGYSRSITWQISRVNAVKEKPQYFYATEMPLGPPGTLVVNLQGAPVGVILPDLDAGDLGGDLGGLFEALAQGMAPVYPADHFNAQIANPPEKGEDGETKSERPWLGTRNQVVGADLAEALGLPKRGGIRLTNVYRGHPAAEAGLQPGDFILGIDEESFAEVEEPEDLELLRRYVGRKAVGDEVTVKFIRDGEERELSVFLGARPIEGKDAPSHEDERFELTVREITFFDRDDRNLADDFTGVVVKEIEGAGWAGIAGIRKGDIILKVGDLTVDGISSFEDAMEAVQKEKPSKVIFYVRQGLNNKFLDVEPSWGSDDEF